MKYIKNRYIMLESKSYTNDVINDICIGMSIVNPDFLSPILDKGLISRYTQNNTIFLNDLKTILFKNTKLKVGKLSDGKIILDDDVSIANRIFNMNSFNIEKDWNMLIGARNIARNIYDKLLFDSKLTPEMIKFVYWVTPNKENYDFKHDITIELEDGRQFNIILNRTMNMSGVIGFSNMISVLLEDDYKKIYSDVYSEKWDKLTQEWVRLSYDNANPAFRTHIERFVSSDRIGSITYENFYKIVIADANKKILGQEVYELDNNYTHLYELLADMYKNKVGYKDYNNFRKEWSQIKKVTLNSNIIEDLLYNQFELLDTEEQENGENEKIKANGKLKLNFIKLFANILKCDTDVNQLYFSKTSHTNIPSRKHLKDIYNQLDCMYKIHNAVSDDVELKDDFTIEFDIYMNSEIVCSAKTFIGFIKEMDKLSVKYKIDLSSDFNYKMNK